MWVLIAANAYIVLKFAFAQAGANRCDKVANYITVHDRTEWNRIYFRILF